MAPKATHRTCIYCGARIGRGTHSREHVFAEWIRSLFVQTPPNERLTVVRHTQGRDQPLVAEEWLDEPFNLRVKDLCRPCNSGFSSDIENAAKPMLTALIQGDPVVLRPDAQMRVAVWAMKLILNLQHSHSGHRLTIPASDFRWFRQHRWPLPGEQLWLAAYDGSGDWPASYRHFGLSLLPAGSEYRPQPTNGHAVAVAVGHLVIRAVGNTLDKGTIRVPPPEIAHALVQLWPASGNEIRWPPPAITSGNAGLLSLVSTVGVNASDFG